MSPVDLEHYDRLLRAAARSASRSEQVAEDVTQEVWLEALRNPPGHLQQFGGWLRVAARRVAARLHRRDENRRHRELVTARSEDLPGPDQQVMSEALRARVERAIDGLDAPYREVVHLHLGEGRTAAAIATELGRSASTVRSQLHRGIHKLRRDLRDEERELRGSAGWWAAWLARVPRTAALWVIAAGLGVVGLFALKDPDPNPVRTPATVTSHASLRGPEDPAGLGVSGPRTGQGVGGPATPAPARPEEAPREPALPGLAGLVTSNEVGFEGAEVWFAPGDDPARGRIVARTDVSGSFALEHLDPDGWIWADAPGLLASDRYQLRSVPSRSRDSILLELQRELGRLTIDVVDWRGQPVANAEVWLSRAEAPPVWGESGRLELPPTDAPVRTDEHGRASRDQPRQGRATVVVQAAGRAPHAEPHRFNQPALDRLLEVTLPEPAVVSGWVVDRGGAPAAGARVQLHALAGAPVVQVACNEHGYYELPPTSPAEVTVIAAGTHGSARSRLALVAGERRRLDLQLGDGHAIVGRALCGNEPLADWTVQLGTAQLGSGDLLGSGQWSGAPRTTLTGPSGEFRFDGLREDGMSIFLFAPGAAFPMASRSHVEFGQHVVLEVAEDRPTHAVAGRIAPDAPEDGLRLELESDAVPYPIELPVDPRGRFALAGLPAGEYVLRVYRPDTIPVAVNRFELSGGRTRQLGTVSVPALASLTIDVTSRDGTPVLFRESGLIGAGVRLVGAPGQGQPDLLEFSANAQHFHAVPPGPYVLKVRTTAHATEVLEVQLSAGESRYLTFSPPPGESARIALSLSDPLPAGETMHCEATWEGVTRDLTPLLTAADGARSQWRLHLEWAHGRHLLNAWTSTGRTGQLAIDVEPGGAPRQFELRLD